MTLMTECGSAHRAKLLCPSASAAGTVGKLNESQNRSDEMTEQDRYYEPSVLKLRRLCRNIERLCRLAQKQVTALEHAKREPK